MKVTATRRIGGVDITVEVDEHDDDDALLGAIGIVSVRETCNVCGDTGLDSKRIESQRAGESGKYIYTKIHCPCGASSTLGKYTNGGRFWKEYEVYQRDGEAQPDQQVPQRAPASDNGGEPKISGAAIDALNQKLHILEWSPKEVQGWLNEHFGVTKMQELTDRQSREAYKRLEAEVKSVVPF